MLASPFDVDQVLQPPAGPPPTPRHTGIKAMVKGLFVDFSVLPSRENALWAGVGGGLALAVHPLDDNVHSALVGNTTAENFFKPGAVLGALPTLLGSASIVYAVGRVKDEPKVSHVGMDLIQAIGMSEDHHGIPEVCDETGAAGSKRPHVVPVRPRGRHVCISLRRWSVILDGDTRCQRTSWRRTSPTSRLPANRHWLSDVVFGSAVGIIAGRTVTSHEAQPFPVVVNRHSGRSSSNVRASRPVTMHGAGRP